MRSSRQFDTVPEAFASVVAAAAAQPFLTWYDDASGDRTELSGATLANWVAKTANLISDGCGLGPGDRATVDAPPHWQSAAVLLGCWSAGLAVVEPGAPVEVAFAAADRAATHVEPGTEVFGLALAPLAAPMRTVPAGVTDFVIEVRTHGDHFSPVSPVGPEDPAVSRSGPQGPASLTHRELCRTAVARATALGIAPGARVLIDAAAHPDPLDWLLAPLLTGCSVILCGNLDPTLLPRRVETEQVRVTLTAI